jgi:signal transduction histidine kinase
MSRVRPNLAEPDFRKLFESIPGQFLVLSPALYITAVSDAYLELTATNRKDLLGKAFFETVAPGQEPDLKNLKSSLQRVLDRKTKDEIIVSSYAVSGANEKTANNSRSILNSPVKDDFGEIIYIMHKVEDVPELRRLENESSHELKMHEEQLLKSEKDLEEALNALNRSNAELETFSYSVSHDLRAPLRAVNGFTTIIEEDYGNLLDEEGKRLLQLVRYNADKMEKLIDNLLVLSRLGKKEAHKTMTDMNDLVEGALIEINKSTKHAANIRVSKLHPARADYGLINQVFVNLLSNAIKYSSKNERPEVEISSVQKSGETIYSVRDNGVGFDMKYAHKLFGVFQRLHSDDEFEGTGTGLTIVRRIVEKHGGKVWPEAEKNKGATFYFSLPE